MSLQSLGLGLLFTARDQASSAVVGLTRNVHGLEGQAARTSNALRAGLGGLAAVAVGAGLSKVVDAAGDFEFGMAQVGNVAMATASDMNTLRDAAFEAGLKTQFSPTQAVDGLLNLAQAGFSAAESAKLLDRSLVLAQAGQISIGQATATTATAIKLFNLQGRDQETLVDKLLKTTNLFKIGATDLEGGLAKTSAAALLTNQSIDEMLLTVGLIKNVFPDAGEAGNSISRAMQNLAQKADKVKSQFGVDVIDPETGGFKKTLDIFLELDAASAKSFPNVADRAKALSKLLGAFGVKGFAAAVASVKSDATKLGISQEEAAARLRSAITGAEGTADQFLAGINSTFKGQKIILQGAVETLMVALGEPLLLILQPMMKTAAEVVSNLARAIRDMDPGLKAAAAKFALVAGTMLGAVSGIALLRVGATLLAPLFRAVAVSAAGTVVAMLPLIAVGAVVAAAVLGLRDALGSGATEAMSFVDVLKQGRTVMAALSSVMMTGRINQDAMNDLWATGAETAVPFINALIQARRWAIAFFGGMRSTFAAFATDLKSAFSGLGSALFDMAEALGLVRRGLVDTGDAVPSGAFSAGAAAARVMVFALESVARVMGAVIRFGAQVVTGIRGVFADSGPVIEEFSRAIGTLAFNLGIAGDAMADGSGEGRAFGETLGAGIGRMLILGVRFATVMVDATTRVVAAVKEILPVVTPVFEFLIDHAEELAYIFGAKIAFSAGVSAVAGIMGFGRAVATIGTKGLNTVLHLLSMVPVLGAQAGVVFGVVRGVIVSIATAGARAVLAFGRVSGAILLTGARATVAGIMNIPMYLMAIKSGAVAAARWIYVMGLRLLAASGRGMIAGLTAVAVRITAIGTASGAAITKAGGLKAILGGLGRSAGGVALKFASWAGPIAAAALAGWEIGSWLNETLGLSEQLGSALARLAGVDEKARTQRAQAKEKRANEAIAELNKSGGLKGRVISGETTASITEKLKDSVIGSQITNVEMEEGTKAAQKYALELLPKRLTSKEIENFGFSSEELAAIDLLRSGLALTEEQASAKEAATGVRAVQERAAFEGQKGILAQRVIGKAAAGEDVGIEDVKRTLAEGTAFVNLAGLQFRRTAETEAANISALIEEIRIRDATTAAQITASIAAAQEAATAAKAAAERPMVLQADGRQIATVVGSGTRTNEDDLFLGGDGSSVLD